MTVTKSFKKGDVIFKEGSWELAMYDITSGKVGIYAKFGTAEESLLTEVEAGKYFGEMGLIDALPRSATAVALEDTETVVIDSIDFESYISTNPEKITDIFQKLCSRLRELSDDYVEACAAVAEYVAREEADKPKGLLAKIKKLLLYSEDYADIMPAAYEDLLRQEQMNHILYF